MKNKIILSLLLIASIFTITGCGKEKRKEEKKVNENAIAFKEEYEKLNGVMASYGKEHRSLSIPEDNPYIKSTNEEILEKLNNKDTFYLYVGDSMCPWCRSVIEQSIKTAKEYGIDKIYYLEFWDDDKNELLRDVYQLVDKKITKTVEETEVYKKLLELSDDSLGLRNYTVKDKKDKDVEVNKKRLYGPSYLYIKNGKVVKYTDARSAKQKGALDELTDEILKDEEENFNNLFTSICDNDC